MKAEGCKMVICDKSDEVCRIASSAKSGSKKPKSKPRTRQPQHQQTPPQQHHPIPSAKPSPAAAPPLSPQPAVLPSSPHLHPNPNQHAPPPPNQYPYPDNPPTAPPAAQHRLHYDQHRLQLKAQVLVRGRIGALWHRRGIEMRLRFGKRRRRVCRGKIRCWRRG